MTETAKPIELLGSPGSPYTRKMLAYYAIVEFPTAITLACMTA